LLGFRYLHFHEELSLSDNANLFVAPGTLGLTSPMQAFHFATSDFIRARNHFYGAQVGLDLNLDFGKFFVSGRAKGALGATHEVVDIDSSGIAQTGLTFNTLLPAVTTPGGLLGGPLDVGRHSRDRICFVPEAEFKIGYYFTSWLRGYVGYNVLYVSDVVRTGNQTGISTTSVQAMVGGTTSMVNVSQPVFRFQDTHVWAQGIDFGLEFRY